MTAIPAEKIESVDGSDNGTSKGKEEHLIRDNRAFFDPKNAEKIAIDLNVSPMKNASAGIADQLLLS